MFSFGVSTEAMTSLLLSPGAERIEGCVSNTGHTLHTASTPPVADLRCAATMTDSTQEKLPFLGQAQDVQSVTDTIPGLS